MSDPKSDANGDSSQNDGRPIQDELICLKQAVNILKLVEEVGRAGDFEEDTGQIVDVIKSARRMIEEVIEALTAHFAAQGGAT